MNKTSRILITALLCTAAVACSKKVKEVPPADTGPTHRPRDRYRSDHAGRLRPGQTSTATPACASAWCTSTSTRMRCVRNSRPRSACHAKYLRDRPSSRMTLEGNADERGSREYNLGLGERRGNAVSSALQANGGSGAQITVTSYGEERPTCTESNEDCWAKNRRVEIVYTAK